MSASRNIISSLPPLTMSGQRNFASSNYRHAKVREHIACWLLDKNKAENNERDISISRVVVKLGHPKHVFITLEYALYHLESVRVIYNSCTASLSLIIWAGQTPSQHQARCQIVSRLAPFNSRLYYGRGHPLKVLYTCQNMDMSNRRLVKQMHIQTGKRANT